MKKLFLSVSIIFMSLYAYPQTGNLNRATDSFDYSNNPSGIGFSGVGGANNATTSQETTTNTGSTVSPRRGVNSATSTVPGTTLPQQRQEERGNFAGGAMGGETEQGRRYPSNSTVAPTRPDIPAATGVGTGAPTSN